MAPPSSIFYVALSSVPIFVILIAAPGAHGAVNFQTCLEEVRSGVWGPTGGTDNRGHPVSNISTATAVTYSLCVTACGSGPEPFSWDTFSQQFGSWLLPWLALISQLPFGTHSFLQNLFSMLLAVGSPTLAAYSLAVTVLNSRWIARRFSLIRNPNSRNAVKALSSLQQAPLVVTQDPHLLASLILLPENEKWWCELVSWLDYTHTWSISAGTSVVWVIVAYVFTVIDSLQGDITQGISAHGQGIGSIWLWLLPVVTGWLQLSPKCDKERLHLAMRHANERAYVAAETFGPVLVKDFGEAEYAFSLAAHTHEYDAVRYDELCTAPIYNYARVFTWAQSVEVVARMFEAASTHACRNNFSEEKASVEPFSESRVERNSVTYVGRWAPGVFIRFFVAAWVALTLQWGTTGAAMMVNYYTPTYGIGCRVGSYLLYGYLGTLSWILIMSSTFLAHYWTSTTHPSKSARMARRLSITLSIIGKVVAYCNAIWIVLACVFQFVNFYDRCWCNSSVIGLGEKAYNVLEITLDEVPSMKFYWTIGCAIAAGSATKYALFVNLFLNPRLPR